MDARFTWDFVSGQFAAEYERQTDLIATAVTAAVAEAGEMAKTGGRASIAAGGFSSKWQNALRLKVFPQSGVSLHPAAFIYDKIAYAGVLHTGMTISGNPILWIPLPNVPFANGKRLTPAQYQATIGPLKAMRQGSSGKPMLFATVRATDARLSKPLSRSLLKRGRNAKRGTLHSIPVFVGVSSVTDPQKFDVTGAIKKAADRLPALIAKHFED